MTDFIPLFPLELVVFPGEEINLHIFEPRYKQLIRECDQNGITFGIPASIKGKVMEFGTEMELVKILKKNPNRTVDVTVRGIGVFKIHDFFPMAHNKMYAGGDIERVSGSDESNGFLYEKILKNIELLFKHLSIKKQIPADKTNFTTYEIAHHVGFSIRQEYQLLTILDEISRQEFIANHLTQLIPTLKEMERLRRRAQMNGHFVNEELGR